MESRACRKVIAIVLVLLAARTSLASGSGVALLGYGEGGTQLAPLTGGQNYDIRAGTGIFAELGGVLPVIEGHPARFEAQLTIGYLSASRGGKEDNVTWKRVPLELIYFLRNDQQMYRFGWGPVWHLWNGIEAKGLNAGAARTIDDAFGWTVTFEKLLQAQGETGPLSVGIKYNFIKYRSAGFASEANGDALYITVTALGIGNDQRLGSTASEL